MTPLVAIAAEFFRVLRAAVIIMMVIAALAGAGLFGQPPAGCPATRAGGLPV